MVARRPPKRTSIPLRLAAEQLTLCSRTVERMVARDVFTALRPHGRGKGKRVYLRTDEVELFGETRDENAVRDLRYKMRRLKTTA